MTFILFVWSGKVGCIPIIKEWECFKEVLGWEKLGCLKIRTRMSEFMHSNQPHLDEKSLVLIMILGWNENSIIFLKSNPRSFHKIRTFIPISIPITK